MIASVFAPALAGGDPVGDVLNGVGAVVGGAGQRAGTPPNYVPPEHGTNPHGQGTVASVDLNPSNTNPYPGIPPSGQEEIVVGSSRGEQNGNNYHGRVTLAYVNLVPLIGPIDIFIESSPGQTNTGPTGALNTALANLCAGSGGAACLAVLPMSSSTTGTGSQNSFALATFSGGAGGVGLNAGAGQSSGNIQQNRRCQTATGSSSLASAAVTVPGLPLGQPTADVMSSSSTSTACNSGGQKTTTNDSNTLTLVGNGIPVPAAGCPGPNEVANTVFTLPLGLGAIVCNANDANNGQSSVPYGVREALDVFVTLIGNTVKVSLSASESQAVAPAEPDAADKKRNSKGIKGKRAQGEGPGVAGEASPGGDTLPFTGENLLLLGLVGAGLIGLGLLGMAGRERRPV